MKLTFDITRQDYLEFNKFHFFDTKLNRTIITGASTVVILQLFLNREQFNWTATVISSIACILVYIFVINRSLNRTKNIPKKNGTILGQKEIEFTDDKITYKTSNSEGSSDWSAIKVLKESSKAFYLYMDTNMAILVPKRVFNNTIEEAEFRNLINRKINNKESKVELTKT